MGGGKSRVEYVYMEDHESKRRAQETLQQLQALQDQMKESQKIQSGYQDALSNAAKEKKRELDAQQARMNGEKRRALQEQQQAKQRELEEQQGRMLAEKQRELKEQEEELMAEKQRELAEQRDRIHQEKKEEWERLKRQYPVPEYLKDFINEVLESAVDNAARSPFVNVALLGDSGTGKSSLIRAILQLLQVELPPNQMPKISMEGDGTTVPTRFPLVSLGQVSLWDLPGQGTSKIPSHTYLRNMGLKYFDVVVIVSDGRWSEGDASLLSAIYAAGIRCVLVRSKVDQAVEAGEVDKNQSPAETLNEVRAKLQSQTGLVASRVHLLTARQRFWNEFGCPTSFCEFLKEEVYASLEGKPLDEMFEARDVEMDQSEVAMEQLREVDFYRLDRENGCFAPAGTRTSRA